MHPQSATIVDYMDVGTEGSTGLDAGLPELGSGDATTDTHIKNFFARPVRIDNYTWLEADSVGVKQSIAPWHLWANNSAVKSKLNNYAFFRGDLRIKFVMNASPFYYGLTMVNYLPLPVFKPTTIVNDASTRYLIPHSQRPHVYLNPENDGGIEFTLPFIYNFNMLNVLEADDFTNMGTLSYIIYSALQSANGATGTGISISTYAWVDNIVLSGATVGMAVQSDSFEQEGVISKPASMIASAASALSSVPIIGKFAQATAIGASAISAIASMFGFTNVPIIEATMPVRPEAYPKLASTDISFPVEKLTVDSKNELSVDPRIVGLPNGVDELQIAHIVERQSYLCKATWTTANLNDDLLFYSRVNPRLYDSDALTQRKVYHTPMSFISNVFDNWRGDIIFTFKIIASKYHKGRLRISFDPSGDTTNNLKTITNSTNIVHTTIVDLSETKEVSLRLPYQQASQFLTIRTSTTEADKGWAVNTAFGTYPYDRSYDNGVITVRVLNILTAPIASSSVDILVFVKAADSLEFANPTHVDSYHTTSFLEPQSDTLTMEDPEVSAIMGKSKLPHPRQYAVHFGENIKSLRQLLHRYEYHSANLFTTNAPAFANTQMLLKHFYKMPTTPGYISTGTETAVKLVGVGNYAYNYCQMTLLSYLSNAFLAYRGSVNWTFDLNAASAQTIGQMRVSRNNVSGFQAAYATLTMRGQQKNYAACDFMTYRFSGLAGQAITNPLTNCALNVQCPMYTQSRFQSTSPANANYGSALDGSLLDCFSYEAFYVCPPSDSTRYPTLHSFVAAGNDFSLHFFLNVPTMYVYSATPTPAP